MIKVKDLAYVRFSAPDLDAMQRFATSFGLEVAGRSDDLLYCRGTDTSPYVHVTERGAPGFAGAAFEAASAADLEAAAGLDGASAIAPLDGPAGGSFVRFTDPDGFVIDVVHGREDVSPLPVRKASPLNRGSKRARLGEPQRVERGPAQVKRIGHFVLRVSSYPASAEWYRSRFGFIDSDRIYLGEPDNLVSAFMRCDRGDEFVDHHTFLAIGLGEPGFDHAAFEVEDFDALMLGHEHLAESGYEHHAGVGRHILGSQIFDYWKDPWGHVVEHFTDGDLLDAGTRPGLVDPGAALGTQWGTFLP